MKFPWRVFFRFVVLQTTLLSALLATWGAVVAWAFGFPKERLPILAVLIILGAVVSLGLTLWIGRKFFLPLGRLVERAHALSEVKPPTQAFPADEDEEWEVVESAMERAQMDLKLTFERLLQGRTEIRTLMSALDDAIVAFDRDGRTLFYNERFAKNFIPVSQQGQDVYLEDVFRDPSVREAFIKSQVGGHRVNLQCHLAPLGTPDLKDYQLAVAPLAEVQGAGSTYGVIAIFHDISDLKQAERFRIEFVGNASHELRTPLTSIKGYVSTLQADVRSGRAEDSEKFLRIIDRNVDRLIALVNDLLDLSSMESHSQKLDPVWVSTQDISESILKTVEPEATSRGQKLVLDVQVNRVYGDVRKIEQVLTNLVANAVKYIPTGRTVKVNWESAQTEDGRRGVYLHVVDDGMGIERKHLARIFERFYRVDEGRARDAGGTGLGLAIVKHIMLSHNGWVKAQSEIGEGSRFTCFFPDPVNT